jgi:hypothetical protein
MKTFRRLTACTILLAATMVAQPSGASTTGSTPDPAVMVTHRVAWLTSLLTLTVAQQNQATTIFTNAVNTAKPIHDNLATVEQSMQAAVKSNATATIAQLATTIGSLTGQLVAVHNQAQAAFYALLTADQQAKLNQTAPAGGRGPGMMGGGMMGGHMMGGRMGGGMGAGMMGAGGPPWMRQ